MENGYLLAIGIVSGGGGGQIGHELAVAAQIDLQFGRHANGVAKAEAEDENVAVVLHLVAVV